MATPDHPDHPEQPDPQHDPQGYPQGWPEVMLASEVAGYLRISYATVIKMTKAGDIPALSVGREFRYLRTEIDKLLGQPAGRTGPAKSRAADQTATG
ncbi:MAG: helix-turn-helix domain-containing protein [Pseudonocardiaceae bacterium]